jgi:hypothetical protein
MASTGGRRGDGGDHDDGINMHNNNNMHNINNNNNNNNKNNHKNNNNNNNNTTTATATNNCDFCSHCPGLRFWPPLLRACFLQRLVRAQCWCCGVAAGPARTILRWRRDAGSLAGSTKATVASRFCTAQLSVLLTCSSASVCALARARVCTQNVRSLGREVSADVKAETCH